MVLPVPVMVPPCQLTLQVTPVLLLPVTVAVICAVPPTGMLLLAGLIETFTFVVVATVTVACPDLVPSATLVAVTVHVVSEDGAV